MATLRRPRRATSACSTRSRRCRATRSSRRAAATGRGTNEALPIGGGQTISQPLVVAHMCELLDVAAGRPRARRRDRARATTRRCSRRSAGGCGASSATRRCRRLAAAQPAPRRASTASTLLVGDGSLGLPDGGAVRRDQRRGVGAARRPARADRPARARRAARPAGRRRARARPAAAADGALERIGAGAVRFVPLIEGVVTRRTPAASTPLTSNAPTARSCRRRRRSSARVVVGDEHVGADVARERLQARGDVRRVADRRVLQPALGADGARRDRAAVQADAQRRRGRRRPRTSARR